MRRLPSWSPLLLLACACARPAPAPPGDAEAAALRDSVLALETAMNGAVDRGDCATGLGFIGDRRPLFVSGGHVVRTHAALLAMCGTMVAPRAGATFATDSVAAHLLGRDAVYVVREGLYTVRYRDGHARVEHLVMTTIWERGADGWRMVHLHESAIPVDSAAAPPTPARERRPRP